MNRGRLLIVGMWVAAGAAVAGVYWALEPEGDDGRTLTSTDAPLFAADDDIAPPEERSGLPVSDAEASGALYRGGPRHTGRSPFRGPTRAEVLFRYEAGARITAQPVLAEDGTIYLGHHDHGVDAITRDGDRIWRAETGQRVWSAGALRGDTLYVGSDAGVLLALDRASGEVRWRFQADGDVDGAPMIDERGTLYFTGGEFLYALSSDGELQWRFRARGAFVLSTPTLDTDGTLYLASVDNHVYAVAPDGRMRWSYETGDDVSSSPVIGDDGTLFFGSDDQHVHAVTRDGERRWRTHVDGYVRAPVGLGQNGDVIVGVYGPQPRVLSLDAADGSLRWFFPVRISASSEVGIASGPLVDADGQIFFGAQDDYIYSLGPEGNLRWVHQAGGDCDGAPALRSDGTLLIGCDDGTLYAFRDGEETPE